MDCGFHSSLSFSEYQEKNAVPEQQRAINIQIPRVTKPHYSPPMDADQMLHQHSEALREMEFPQSPEGVRTHMQGVGAFSDQQRSSSTNVYSGSSVNAGADDNRTYRSQRTETVDRLHPRILEQHHAAQYRAPSQVATNVQSTVEIAAPPLPHPVISEKYVVPTMHNYIPAQRPEGENAPASNIGDIPSVDDSHIPDRQLAQGKIEIMHENREHLTPGPPPESGANPLGTAKSPVPSTQEKSSESTQEWKPNSPLQQDLLLQHGPAFTDTKSDQIVRTVEKGMSGSVESDREGKKSSPLHEHLHSSQSDRIAPAYPQQTEVASTYVSKVGSMHDSLGGLSDSMVSDGTFPSLRDSAAFPVVDNGERIDLTLDIVDSYDSNASNATINSMNQMDEPHREAEVTRIQKSQALLTSHEPSPQIWVNAVESTDDRKCITNPDSLSFSVTELDSSLVGADEGSFSQLPASPLAAKQELGENAPTDVDGGTPTSSPDKPASDTGSAERGTIPTDSPDLKESLNEHHLGYSNPVSSGYSSVIAKDGSIQVAESSPTPTESEERVVEEVLFFDLCPQKCWI